MKLKRNGVRHGARQWLLFWNHIAAERLADFKVAVGDTFDPDDFDPTSFTTCVAVSGALGGGETRTIPCDTPVRGRYITVYMKGRKYLTICELEVYSLYVAGTLNKMQLEPSFSFLRDKVKSKPLWWKLQWWSHDFSEAAVQPGLYASPFFQTQNSRNIKRI